MTDDHDERNVGDRVLAVGQTILSFDEWLESLLSRLYEEAVDREHPGWPPTWLKAIFAAAVGGALIGLIPLVTGAISSILLGFSGLASASAFAYTVLNPVHTFMETHSAGLPLRGTDLYVAWKAVAFFLVIASGVGFKGGRFAWIIFGALTLPMVWSASPPGGRWVACLVAATWWLLITTLCFGFSFAADSNGYSRQRTRGKPSAREVEAKADGRAKALGHETFTLISMIEEIGPSRT